jgi:FkbM family methyltransferase
MFPEILSQSIIKPLADIFDPGRIGAAIEIGVGTVNFYSVKYKEQGFKCVAVDPLPYQPFLKTAEEKDIYFEEACIYDQEGQITLFCSEHADLSSVNADWWGVDVNSPKKVNAILLTTLLKKYHIDQVTFMKIDTEGSEYEIIKQLKELDLRQIPCILEFEYGGGAIKQTGGGAWVKQFFDKVIGILEILKSLDYKEGLILDSNDIEPVFFDFKTLKDPASLFKPIYEYGNMLVFKDYIGNKIELENVLLKTQSTELAKFLEILKTENAALGIKYFKTRYLKRLINKTKTTFGRLKR